MNPTLNPTTMSPPRRRRGWKVAGLAALGVLLTGLAASCSNVTRTVVIPPEVHGASFVGSANCAECHAEISRDFVTADHARLQARGPNALNMGCESCHGAGSKHAESGGALQTIVNPGKNPESCFQCHLDQRGRFHLPSHHPVLEGKVSCTDCHDPHKGSAHRQGGTSLMGDNQTCYQCHQVQKGPHVFEHEALREGCVTCHHPHGSVNPRLLTQRNAALCLKCHTQQQTAAGVIMIGGRDHAGFLARGTCWSAGCHEAVHGSQVNSSLRF